MIPIEKIREAVLKNRGGHEAADDSQILLIWNSLDEETQTKYLESVKKTTKKESKENADSL